MRILIYKAIWPNDRIYIGKSFTLDVVEALKEASERNKGVKVCLEKYGNPRIKALGYSPSFQEAHTLQHAMIEKHKSYDLEIGYNSYLFKIKPKGKKRFKTYQEVRQGKLARKAST